MVKDQIQIVFPTTAIVAAIISNLPGTQAGEAEWLAEQLKLKLQEANDDCLVIEEEGEAANV